MEETEEGFETSHRSCPILTDECSEARCGWWSPEAASCAVSDLPSRLEDLLLEQAKMRDMLRWWSR